MIILICQQCGKKFQVKFYLSKTAKFCCKKCYWKSIKGNQNTKGKHWKLSDKIRKQISKKLKGEKNYQWAGNKLTNFSGYTFIYKPKHPKANKQGRVSEHMIIAEKCLGRYLIKLEVIHHIGTKYPMNSIENRSDNRPENLYLFASNSKHRKYHGNQYMKNKPQLISNLINT